MGSLAAPASDRSKIGLVVEKHLGNEDELSSGSALIVPQFKVKFGNDSSGDGFTKKIYLRLLMCIRGTNDLCKSIRSATLLAEF